MEEAPIVAGPLEASVRWLPGWYATRLHAVPKGAGETGHYLVALCGAIVYEKARTEWAQRKVDKGVPHCKLCERKQIPPGPARRNEALPSCSFFCEMAEMEYAA